MSIKQFLMKYFKICYSFSREGKEKQSDEKKRENTRECYSPGFKELCSTRNVPNYYPSKAQK